MKRYLLKITVILSFLVLPALTALADTPDAPPPDPGGDPGGGGTPVGAPIDGGLTILLALGIGYGIKQRLAAKDQPSSSDLTQNQPEV